MKIGYARVSTEDQNLSLQIDALEKFGCDRIFQEKVSGVSKNRKEFENMLLHIRSGDTVVVWKLDRLGRSVKQLIDLMEFWLNEEINKKRKPKEASQNYPDGMITTDKRDAAWLYYEEGGIYYCYDCVRKRVDEVNANKEFKTERDYDNGERCTFYIDVANEDCEVECCKCGTPLWSNVDFK